MTDAEFDSKKWSKHDKVYIDGQGFQVVAIDFNTRMVSVRLTLDTIRHYSHRFCSLTQPNK